MKKSKDLVIARMKEAGLQVRMDEVGNVFGRKEGVKSDKGAVMAGSHLDSVLNGGMFDGVLGVISILEAIRVMNDEGFENERPIEMAIFMGEEGSAFKKGLLGSSVAVGKLAVDEALSLKNDKGETLKDALDRLEHRGDFHMDLADVEYFLEMHVEQGPVLDKEKVSIGIVENITGITWVTATIEGEENHAGTTPMLARRDPLVAAVNVVSFANKRATEMVKELGGSTVATVGKMVVFPGAPNIIPGKVELGIDIRDGIEENMENLKQEIIQNIESLEAQYGVETTVEVPIGHPPCPCSQEIVEAIEEAVRENGVTGKRMNSGAGHDAQNIAENVKAGMIFVPSVNGISHSPMEWTDWKDIETGIRILTDTLKRLSRL
jgi:N-carbamoyl-L-amino-acid hydrolase